MSVFSIVHHGCLEDRKHSDRNVRGRDEHRPFLFPAHICSADPRISTGNFGNTVLALKPTAAPNTGGT